MFCTQNSDGKWFKFDRDGNVESRADCVGLMRCDASRLSHLQPCKSGPGCTPLASYRRLDRLGCKFEPDAFWAAADAQLVKAELAKVEPAIARPIWNGHSCRRDDLQGLESLLRQDRPTERRSKRDAVRVLLEHGCKVDLANADIDGSYETVKLSYGDIGPTDQSGLAVQPPLKIEFIVEGASTPPNPVDELPICTALEQLQQAQQFAMCMSHLRDDHVTFRFFNSIVREKEVSDGTEIATNYKEGGISYCHLSPSGAPGTLPRLLCNNVDNSAVLTQYVVVTVPSPVPIPATTPAPAFSGTTTAGSIGFGALLAGLIKWLLGMLKKKRAGGLLPAEADTHEIHDIHVTVNFPRKPKARVHRR
jgi:hypothetical protein